MIFRETGNQELDTIILLHGGGLSYWSLQQQINYLSQKFHVVTPIIDGHGEDGNTTFISIEDSADKLIKYINENHNGKVYAIYGLSLGAQIAIEIISKRKNIVEFAIIESGLVIPMKNITTLSLFMQKILYRLISQKWFAKIQAKTLNIPENMFENYYKDSQSISKQSLINSTYSNGNFYPKEHLKETNAKVLIIVGSKELKIMKKSAQVLKKTIPKSTLYIAEGMNHGGISLIHYQKHLEIIESFFCTNSVDEVAQE
ncbi:alpha/beta hydrolase [Bacillus sp. FJAT-52991]|uniref:Alpha/beta hydrolase n=1 Tax=Bacillus kandeliae TaxID=3129297 RepID=A0ABZ2N3Q3_9BACI